MKQGSFQVQGEGFSTNVFSTMGIRHWLLEKGHWDIHYLPLKPGYLGE
jgi:hypothetical protein